MQNTNSPQRMGIKGIVGIGGCLLGLAIVYFGYGVGSDSPKKEAAAGASATVATDARKPVRAMNFALDNMVFFARELGFTVTSAKEGPVDPSKIALRIENQLQNVRELYRLEIMKNANLAGPITLELDISPSGEVSQVKEASSRIHDAEFKRAVMAEVSKWSFADLVSKNLKLTCPLLFVHEGMDITTLVQWEKSMGNLNEKASLSYPSDKIASSQAPGPARNSLTQTTAAKPAPAPAPRAERSATSEAQVFQIKYATLLRKQPNFNAPSLTSYTTGTKVVVLKKHGDWLEVRSDNGETGFIRQEFVTALDFTPK